MAASCIKDHEASVSGKGGRARRYFGCDIMHAYLKSEPTEFEKDYVRPLPGFRRMTNVASRSSGDSTPRSTARETPGECGTGCCTSSS